MSSRYEFWLTDDKGKLLLNLEGYSFFAYSRSLLGLGTFTMGLPYQDFRKRIFPVFQPDWRVECWRSPATGIPMRRDAVYLLRKKNIYTRTTDNVQIIQLYGRSTIDLLNRRVVVQAAGTEWTRKEGAIDDLMKEIVREQMLYGSALDETGALDNTRAYPEGEFSVQADFGLGPIVTVNCAETRVMDVLKQLKDTSFELAKESTSNYKIYFDILPYNVLSFAEYILDEENADPILDEQGFPLEDETSISVNSGIGLQFQTFAGLYGQDRTLGAVYSVENGNLEGPNYSMDHLEEKNAVIVKGFGRGDSRVSDWALDSDRINQSRWNRCELFRDGSQEPDQDKLADLGRADLWDGEPVEELAAEILNSPGGPQAPRSLYGIDWDLGDLLPIEYGDKRFDVEVSIVYVAMDENGRETVTGRNEVVGQ